MTSPRRSKRCGVQSALQSLDWDSPSTKTGTVKRRPSSCPEKTQIKTYDINIDEESESDLISDKSLSDVEQRIDKIINENRPSSSSSEHSSNFDVIVKTIVEQDDEVITVSVLHEETSGGVRKLSKRTLEGTPKKSLDRRFKAPINPNITTKPKPPDKISDQHSDVSRKRILTSKLKLPFAPSKGKLNTNDDKTSQLLKSPLRRTISNDYVKLKFDNETLVRKTIDGRKINKITPKVQSIIPESPDDKNNPLLNLSPNKKYTVTPDNKVRCDKDNYVIFDPNTGFNADDVPKVSRIPVRSPLVDNVPFVPRYSVISETDSGITSPGDNSGDCASVSGVAVVKDEKSTEVCSVNSSTLKRKAAEQIKIYTDWANHYLERARSRRRAGSSGGLARDCADGLLLADVLEGVTGLKVQRAHRKPRNQQQMLENVQCCLDFLHAQKVQGLEQVTAVDIRDAKLKAVLALFFALSRHKQATKQRTAPPNVNVLNLNKEHNDEASISSLQRITGGALCEDILTVSGNNVTMTSIANRQVGVLQTSIPLPASAVTARRAPPDKRPLPATPHHNGGKSTISASSSRSTSPSGQNPVSFIPRAPNSTSGSRPNSSLIPPGTKIPSAPFNQQQTQQAQNAQQQAKQSSMLDKLRLFNKDKTSTEKQTKNSSVSKRTSSSSGFSSAKSERSDSSLSLNEASNIPNAHIKPPSIGSRNVRQSDVASKDKSSNKNAKTKLVNTKPVKEPVPITKSNSKTNVIESKSSLKLPTESKLLTPKTLLNGGKVNDNEGPKVTKLKPDSKMSKLSGSQLRLSDHSTKTITESKVSNSGLQSPRVQGLQNSNSTTSVGSPANGTGIPKPTAAVKGTFKIHREERGLSKSTNSQLSPIQSNSSIASLSNTNSLPFNRESSNLSKEASQKQMLAVSPMPVPSNGSQMSDSSHSNSTHSNSTGQNSNSSEGSVIYKPSSESESDAKSVGMTAIQNRKEMSSDYISDVISEAESQEKQATQKIEELPQSKENKQMNELARILNGRSRSNSPSHARDNSLGEEENPLMNILPMRPLLRGYNSHLTLPMRTTAGMVQKSAFPHHANTVKANFGSEIHSFRERGYRPGFATADYCDSDLAAGYMSDGDCLRKVNTVDVDRARINDVMDGYMSEGGASLYGRRINYQAAAQQFEDIRNNRAVVPTTRVRGMENTSTNGGVVYRVVSARGRNKTDSSQQTDSSGSSGGKSSRSDTQWKKYNDSPGVGSPAQSQAPSSPSHSRKSDRRGVGGHHSPQHHKREKLTAAQQLGFAPHAQQQQYSNSASSQHSVTSSRSQLQSPSGSSSPRSSTVTSASNGSANASSKVKSSAQNFGYVKRQNGQSSSNGTTQHAGRTAQVSAVPRTKVKVSGGTQTCMQDLQIHKNGIGPKSYSLGGSAAAQLSASVRERLLGSQSLPKPGTHEFAALFHHHRMNPRGGIKISDGSLSDTQTYSEVKPDYGIPYAPWLRHSNTYSASGRLSEGESMESLTSLHSAQMSHGTPSNNSHHHRSSLTHNKLIMHQRDTVQSGRLNRSNSIRSTKSEKLYPSMLQRSSESDYEPYYCLPVQYGTTGQGLNYGTSEPPSPSPRSALSPTQQSSNMHTTPRHSHHYPKKNDEAHGSTASLVSSASAVEERQAMEVRKLRRELADAKEKVHTLTTQLTTNAHVVSAFEQSLSNMTQRLQQLTATAERKDSELTELRQTIELLRKQSIQAGLTTAHMQSMGIKAEMNISGPLDSLPPPVPSSQSSPQRKPGGVTTNGTGVMTRHLSNDSVSSLNSLSSGSSAHDKKQKKKGWLRSSFTKAFSRNAKIAKTAKHSSLSQLSSDNSSLNNGGHLYDDPHTIREGSNENSLENCHDITADDVKDATLKQNGDGNESGTDKSAENSMVDELKRQLREKDLVLTDIRLEALSSAHQLESLKDTVVKMRNEMLNLKQNNERLQRLVTSRSLAGSQTSLGTGGSLGQNEDPRRFSLADQSSTNLHSNIELHSQSLELDFNCLTSTPTLDFNKKKSPEPIYGNKSTCELPDNSDTILSALTVNGSGDDIFQNGLSDRLSGDYDINTVLPPPKSRELAIGESYSDIGMTENQGDIADGKKIAISVYLGQPETFERYFEEIQDTMSEAEHRYYTKQFEKQPSFDSPRISQNQSPETEQQDFPHSTKSNTNSLKSNKSSRSYKNIFNNESTVSCNEFTIAYTYISGKTTWQNLDYIVRKTFKDYLSRIDPGTNLGLNTDSITSYHLGEAMRGPEISFPELLPCGYIVGTVNTLYICLQGSGCLAFDSLIPKNIVQRYVSLLSDHRRVILCGPSGTGKSYLAAKLAEFYVQKTQRRANPAEAVATFNMERKSSCDLRAFVSTVAEATSGAADAAALPAVLLLDNLQHAAALADLPRLQDPTMPLIIGTMSQATCNTTNLHLNHNFRWLLTSNHMEPVKGFLARYLRRKLFSVELSRGRREAALARVLEWLPGVWSTLNAFLEAHASSDVTIGPRLFLACPMDLHASQSWFADVWNYSVVPYVSEAAREGVTLYGRRRTLPDPLLHVKATYPWSEPNNSHTLRQISVDDMGMDDSKQDEAANNNQDPLLNMLMRLQEAANYSGNQSQDSDNASMDSNLTHDSSMGNE